MRHDIGQGMYEVFLRHDDWEILPGLQVVADRLWVVFTLFVNQFHSHQPFTVWRYERRIIKYAAENPDRLFSGFNFHDAALFVVSGVKPRCRILGRIPAGLRLTSKSSVSTR